MNPEINLKQHQQRIVGCLAETETRSILAIHKTGSGKTRTAIATAMALIDRHEINSVWIIAPVVTHEQWKDEIKHWRAPPRPMETWNIMTPQKLHNDVKSGQVEYIQFQNSFLILDEAHFLRTFAQESKGLYVQSLLPAASIASRVLLLTATPIVNGSQDLHSLACLLHGVPIAETPAEWEQIIGIQSRVSEIFRGRVSVYMPTPVDDGDNKGIHTDTGAGQYPTMATEMRHLRMDAAYYKDYLAVQDAEIGNYSDNVKAFLGGDKSATFYYSGVRRVANTLMKSQSPKISAIIDEIKSMVNANVEFADKKQPPNKMAIFSAFKGSGVEFLAKHVLPELVPGEFALITGDTSLADRVTAIRRFNNDAIKVLLFSKAGAEGVDLRGTTHLILLEPQWNMAGTDQATARAVRLGSHAHLPIERRRVNVLKLMLLKPEIKDPSDSMLQSIDEILDSMSRKKQAKAQEMIDMLSRLSIEND